MFYDSRCIHGIGFYLMTGNIYTCGQGGQLTCNSSLMWDKWPSRCFSVDISFYYYYLYLFVVFVLYLLNYIRFVLVVFKYWKTMCKMYNIICYNTRYTICRKCCAVRIWSNILIYWELPPHGKNSQLIGKREINMLTTGISK